MFNLELEPRLHLSDSLLGFWTRELQLQQHNRVHVDSETGAAAWGFAQCEGCSSHWRPTARKQHPTSTPRCTGSLRQCSDVDLLTCQPRHMMHDRLVNGALWSRSILLFSPCHVAVHPASSDSTKEGKNSRSLVTSYISHSPTSSRLHTTRGN